MLVQIARVAMSLIAMATLLRADNGALAYAFPLRGVRIDGKLGDWPKTLRRYAIRRDERGRELAAKTAFEAHFRVGYCLETRSLLLAVEVVDAQHVVSDDPAARWDQHDVHVLYVDPTHSPRGSGAWLFAALGKQLRLMGNNTAWDPRVAEASRDDCEVAVARDGDTTIYEWRVVLGDRLRPGRSFGLDHLICDRDDKRDAALYLWGPNPAKSRGASRCGDVLLVDPAQPLETLRGRVAWAGRGDREFPRRVRVASLDDRELWVQVEADTEGRFELRLPAGEYEISSPFKTFGRGAWQRDTLDPSVRVRVRIGGDRVAEAKPLLLRRLPGLDALYPERGVLWREALAANERESRDATAEGAKRPRKSTQTREGSGAEQVGRADPPPSQLAREIDAFVRAAMKHYHVPGVSLAIVRGGRLAHHATYGYSNFYRREPVTKDTIFEACSITKIVFAFAVQRLVARGLIDLDKPMHEYLALEDVAQDARYRKITARHCLSHQSGFPNWRWSNPDGRLDIKFEPGTRFGYSGEGFEWLGRVAAKLSDKPLEQLLRDEVLTPMGFGKRTHFKDGDELQRVVAHGHWTTRTAARSTPDAIGVAHSMHCDALEMAAFMRALIAGKGLSADAYRRMLTPQRAAPREAGYPGPKWKRSYGLGFELLQSPYGLVYGHGGSNGDFKCRFEIYRDHDLGFVVFTNGSEGEHLYEALRRFLILGKQPR